MESATTILSDNGLFAKAIKGFTSRPMQQEMAESVSSALLNSESLICEAGTGTGKTFAYLVPALMTECKVIISTGTKHLQDQIYHRDLPTVRKILKSGVSTALLKGRANYLCIYRHRIARDVLQAAALQSELLSLEPWVHKTETGDLTEILADGSKITPWVSSTTDNCLGQNCPDYNNCHVLKARKRANEADIIVVNHHLLLADMALRETGFGELLPNIDSIIFDEAHQLPELASQFFGHSFSTRQCLDLSNDTREAYQEEAWDVEGFMDKSYEVDNAVKKLQSIFNAKDLKLEWEKISTNKKTIKSLESLQDCLTRHCDLIEEIHDRGKALDHCYQRNVKLMQRLESILDNNNNEYVQWLEIRGKGVFLHQTPLNVSDEFQNRLKYYQCNSIYTSATLAIGKSFKHFVQQLGLTDVTSKQWPSPFNFEKQTLLYLPKNMPLPSHQDYIKKVIERAVPVLNASQGRAFLLFTSHRALREAAALLINKIDFPVFVQGDHPKQVLLEMFRNSQNGVLLGTSSFWEGVDVKGPMLSCVIIDKLPFAPPDDPVLKARSNKIEENGGNAFMDYQLPQAIINLKQGIGRLIRDDHDYGTLMLCDPRISSKSYGKRIMSSLPPIPVTKALDTVEQFYKKHE